MAIKVVALRIKVASELVDDEEVHMDEEEIRCFPEEALQQLRLRAENMLQGQPLKRLTYEDDDGDDCTLTRSSLDDALTFAVGCDGVTILELKAVADEVPMPTPSMEDQETARGHEQTDTVSGEAASGPEQTDTVSGDGNVPGCDGKIEVHPRIACDGCNQRPILGKRFRCLECQDYDLCERCYKKNKSDGCVHSHEAWAQVASDTSLQLPVPGPVDVVDAYYLPETAKGSVHLDHECDGCNASPITGIRFHCTTARNYDLCEACYGRRAEFCPYANEPFEQFLVLPVPEIQKNGTDNFAVSVELGAGQKALQALAVSLDDFRCAAALKALSEHHDERIRTAVASVTGVVTDKAEVQAAASSTDVMPTEIAQTEEHHKNEKQEAVVQYSASVLEAAPLVLGVEATEDTTARGDVTEEFQDVLRQFGLQQAYRLGRTKLLTSSSTSTMPTEANIPAEAKAVVINNGSMPWPESAAIRIAAGDAFGLPDLPLGAMQPGEVAEIIFDLNLPLKQEPGEVRSFWTLVDSATGEPFGPLFIIEALWTMG